MIVILTGALGGLIFLILWFLAIWLGGRIAEKYQMEKPIGWLIGLFFHLFGVAVFYVLCEFVFAVSSKNQPPTA